MEQNPQFVSPDNSMDFLSDDGGKEYNQCVPSSSSNVLQTVELISGPSGPSTSSSCHFWSNFEIGDLDFWRGEAYSKYFDHLEAAGGFYYERWGDAPVHSIGAGLFARKDQIKFFVRPRAASGALCLS